MLISRWVSLVGTILLVSLNASIPPPEILQEYLLPGELYHDRFLIERKIAEYPRLIMFEALDIKEGWKRKILSIHTHADDKEAEIASINKTIRKVQHMAQKDIKSQEAVQFSAVEEYFVNEKDGYLVEVMDGQHVNLQSIIDEDEAALTEETRSIWSGIRAMFSGNCKSEVSFFYLLKSIYQAEHYLRTKHNLIIPFFAVENIGIGRYDGSKPVLRTILLNPEYRETISRRDHLMASSYTLETLCTLISIFKNRNTLSMAMEKFFIRLAKCYKRGTPVSPFEWLQLENALLSEHFNVPAEHLSRL